MTKSRLYKIYITYAANSATAVHSASVSYVEICFIVFVLDSSTNEVTIRRTNVVSHRTEVQVLRLK